MIKTRSFPDKNYKAIYFNGKTIRMTYDSEKPILDLDWPEFYDIKLTNRCNGNCPYCYQDSNCNDEDYEAINKLDRFFGSMTDNQKPFQIAYGGGEPTLHYQFYKIMKLTKDYGIAPNYTTNGIWIYSDNRDKIIEATKKYCEGVAVSCHHHLTQYWGPCASILIGNGIFVNMHNMISDKDSIDTFIDIYNAWHGDVKYFVVLPVINHGRANGIEVEFDYFFNRIGKLNDISDIAFGANFYPYLKEHKEIKVALYEPEIMSKYLNLKDMSLYPSSFNTDKAIRKIEL